MLLHREGSTEIRADYETQTCQENYIRVSSGFILKDVNSILQVIKHVKINYLDQYLQDSESSRQSCGHFMDTEKEKKKKRLQCTPM